MGGLFLPAAIHEDTTAQRRDVFIVCIPVVALSCRRVFANKGRLRPPSHRNTMIVDNTPDAVAQVRRSEIDQQAQG
jgi:hypothetical protein